MTDKDLILNEKIREMCDELGIPYKEIDGYRSTGQIVSKIKATDEVKHKVISKIKRREIDGYNSIAGFLVTAAGALQARNIILANGGDVFLPGYGSLRQLVGKLEEAKERSELHSNRPSNDMPRVIDAWPGQ